MRRGVLSGARGLPVLALAIVLGALIVPQPALGHSGGHDSGPQEDHYFFTIKDFRVRPGHHEVHKGDHVTWKNEDGAVHSIVLNDGAIETGDIAPGEAWEWTAVGPEEYTFQCEYHSDVKGTLTVLDEKPPNTPPSLIILNPQDGQNVTGRLRIHGTASDPDEDGVMVRVRIDGGPWRAVELMQDGTWSVGWNTGVLKDGEHTIEAAAQDYRTAYSPIDRVTVWVDNSGSENGTKPATYITYPYPNARISGTVAVEGFSSDGTGGTPNVENESDWTVKVRVDEGAWRELPGSRQWSMELDTTKLSNGPHVVEAVTVLEGVTGPPHRLQVAVHNDAAPPITVQITQPGERARLSDTFRVQGTAYDPEGRALEVLVRVDKGEWYPAKGTNPWFVMWNSTGLTNGPHVIEAMARSDTRSSPLARVTVFTDNGERVERPRVAFTSPAEDAQLAGTVLIRGTAESPSGRAFTVQVRVDNGPWEPVSGLHQWAFTLDTSTLANGVHHVTARAFDDQSYSKEVTRRLLVANAPSSLLDDEPEEPDVRDLEPLVPAGAESQSTEDEEKSRSIPGPGAFAAPVAAAAAAALARGWRRVTGRAR